MKKYTILKGMHYSNFFPRMGWITKCHEMTKTIVFNESCKYVINEESCVNKLFGWQFGIFGVHYRSFRFGWTYDRFTDNINLYTYMYINGKLFKTKFASVKIGEEVRLSIKYNYEQSGYSTIEYAINGSTLSLSAIKIDKNNLYFTLGFYFGGKSRAPHKMWIIENN